MSANDISAQAHAIAIMPATVSAAAIGALIDALEASYLEFTRWNLF